MADASELPRTSGPEPLFGSWLTFLEGSIGAKMLMAITGIGLWVFLIGHMAGNLTVYAGAGVFNAYAETLHSKPALLWGVRLAMIFGFPLHVLTSIRTQMMNNAAKPIDYVYGNKSRSTWAAKYMIVSGLVVAFFLAYHLAHFTWRKVGLGDDALGLSAYEMVVRGFSNPLLAGLYIVAMGLLTQHLSHGLYSMFQHLGLWGKRWTPWLKTASLVVGWGMCLLFASVPVAVLMGMVR